ncbi:MAG TPA: hypothetical protein HA362_03405 [Nanoarchaeota archaeon]|nr:hypothetical protein [Nanoarchaeota archaeon]
MADDKIPGLVPLSKASLKLLRGTARKEPELCFADESIAAYAAFRGHVYNPQSVLYPSCGFDASPARVFPNVTFVDIDIGGNEGCVRKLQEAGLHAFRQDIRDYTPQELHDLLILLNPCIRTEWASRHLKPGGYVLANDYHGNASEMHRQPEQFTLWGVIDSGRDGNRAVVSRNLEHLFEPVANEEELRTFRPDYYAFLNKIFRVMAMNTPDFNADGPFEEVWARYRGIMSEGMPSKRVAGRYIFIKNP